MRKRARRMARLVGGSAASATASGLPPRLKAGVEALSGLSMAGVTVHRNSPEPARLNALAFARDSAIHLGPGQDSLLPHEAWHVAQQRRGGVRPTARVAGVAVNEDGGLEREADAMGRQAAVLGERRTGDLAPPADSGGVTQRFLGSGYLVQLAEHYGVAATLTAVAAKLGVSVTVLVAGLAAVAVIGGAIGIYQLIRYCRGERAPQVTKETVRSPAVALYVLQEAFGQAADIEFNAQLFGYHDEGAYAEAYEEANKKEPGESVGFTVRAQSRSDRDIHVLWPEASYDVVVHELVHHNASSKWNGEFGMKGLGTLHEGVTQMLTMYALNKFGLPPSGAYMAEVYRLQQINKDALTETQTLVDAYFNGSSEAFDRPIGEQRRSLNEMANKLTLDSWEGITRTTLAELRARSSSAGGSKKDL